MRLTEGNSLGVVGHGQAVTVNERAPFSGRDATPRRTTGSESIRAVCGAGLSHPCFVSDTGQELEGWEPERKDRVVRSGSLGAGLAPSLGSAGLAPKLRQGRALRLPGRLGLSFRVQGGYGQRGR